ncbi:hypothetical protein IJH72_02715 [Candidatus Saccharibacteria bacterium]|nr:hypothetical protein [Candidatus Saccharibacteria bacterium]
MENPKVILKRIIRLAVTVFLVAILRLDGSVFATINPNNYTLNFGIQNQNQGIEIMPADNSEKYVSTMRTLNVSTNAPSGYRIYVNVPEDESSQGSLVLSGGTSSSPSIAPINANPSNATTLGSNTWGFGIPNTTTGLPSNNFSSSYTSGTPSTSSTYAGTKISPTYTLVRNVTSAVSGTDSFNLYYGMRLGSDVITTPGTYSTNIKYYAFIDATDVIGGEATITPSSGPKSGYESVTITTSLKTDFVPQGISVTIGGQACDNPRGGVNTGVLSITCVTRAHTPEAVDVVVDISSLGISYTIQDGYTYLETGDVKITNVSYVSGINVNGTPHPSVDNDNNIDFDLTFKSGVTQNNETFQATYSVTMSNTTSSDYIFTAPSANLTLRLSSTTTSDVYYELSGISVGDTIPANSTVTFNIILTADYVSGTHGVEGGMEVEPVEDKSGSLTGSISGSTSGDLSGNNDLAQFQLSVQNTYKTAKSFTIGVLGSDFMVTDSNGGYLSTQTINAESTGTYTFYLKKSNGAVFGSDYVNAMIVISYDGTDTNCGTLRIHVDRDPSYVDNQAPIISDVTVTRNDTIGSATLTWNGTDNVGIKSYSIYVCTKSNDVYSCDQPITGISGNTNTYTLTGLGDGLYGIVVVGFDDEGNTATQAEIDGAQYTPGPASRTEDTELRWTFNITGKITNGSLSNNGQTIQMGATYTGTINPNSSYSTPSSVSITMNGRSLTTGQYTYRSGSITINIPVDGDIEITASCPWDWCLIEGTLITLADGTKVPIEDITYDTLLKVWNYETGSVGAEYPAWIEKRGVTQAYRITRFDDGTELKTAGWHGVFDVDANAFISVDDPNFGVGSRVYKVINDELQIVTVTDVEIVQEEIGYYHVVSSQYYNIIAEDVITTDGAVYLSNLYGFDENIKWPAIREQIISDPNNLYTFEDFEDIGMPRKMFDDLRVREGKYLATKYGISLQEFKLYLLSNQLNTDIWLHYCDGSETLREQFCPTPPSEDESQDTIPSASDTNVYTPSGDTTTNSEPVTTENADDDVDDNDYNNGDPEFGYTEPLGKTTKEYYVSDNTTDILLAGSALAGAGVAVATALYLSKKDDE